MIELIILLVIVGVCLYLIEAYVPMDPAIKTVIRVVVVLCLVLYLLSAFGILDVPVPRFRR
jgi:membrane-bound ClpP family serine protease